MCGIFGWQLDESGLTFEERFALSFALAAYNDQRGGHSWGYSVDGDVVRGLGKAIRRTKGGADPGDMACATTLVGHTRFATTGAHTVKNAHPFDMGRVIGAHNGVVYNHSELNAKYDRKMTVDSQHLFAHLAEGRKLNDVRAYGAVEYWMAGHPHTVRLGRFNGGTLAAAQLDCGVVWSSTRVHLEAALLHVGLDDKAEFIPLTEDALYVVRGGRISRKSKLQVGERAPLKVIERRSMTPAEQDVRWDAIASYEQHVAAKRGAIYFDRKKQAQAKGKKGAK